MSDKKFDQLKMPIGTASARLKKNILFYLLFKHNENVCYQCNEKINTSEELSVEHKIPWIDSDDPIDLFFDINNIAFSHLKCNIGSARRVMFGSYMYLPVVLLALLMSKI